MDDDTTNDYLADAITDDLTTDLSRIPGAWVIAREFGLHLQGQGHRCAADRPRTWRPLCAGGQRPPDRRAPAGQRPARLRRDRRASVVGPVRRRDLPTGRRAAADRRPVERHGRHQHGGDRERAQPTRAAGQSRRIRSDPAGARDVTSAADAATGHREVGAVRARPCAGSIVGSCHGGDCVLPDRWSAWRHLGQFRQYAARRAVADPGARAGTRVGNRPQHNGLLAPIGGTVRGGDRGRRARHPARSEPDAEPYRALQ